MPLTEAELTTLQDNEAAIDQAVATQDAFIKTLVADPVVVTPPLAITAVPAQVWTIGVPLSAIQLDATGGAGSGYEFSGTLVAGTSVSETGEISGTPSGPAAAAAEYTVTVHDPSGNSATTVITITVVAPVVVTPPTPLTIATPPVLTLTIGKPMTTVQLVASGGSGMGYKFASVQNDTVGLPPGVSCNATGAVSGTPSTNPASDTTNQNGVQFTVTDSAGNTATSTEVTWTLVEPVTPPPTTVPWPTPSLPAGYAAPDGLTFPSQAQWYTTFAASEAPTKYLPYWYKEGDVQNGTVMDQENVSFGPNGLGLTLTAAKSGGLISTAPWAGATPGVLLAPAAGRPVYLEFAATLPALADGKTPANWIELWLVGQNWPVDKEFDLYESLSGAGYGHFHWGTNNQSIGWSDGINAGRHVFGMFWSIEDSAQFYVDSKLVESIPAADIQNTSPQAIVLGNSLPIQAGVDLLLPTTVQVHYLTLLQNAAA